MYLEDAQALEHEQQLIANEFDRRLGTYSVNAPIVGEWIEDPNKDR